MQLGQFPYIMEHAIPCYVQEYLVVLHSKWQLHRTIMQEAIGAGNKSVVTGTKHSFTLLPPPKRYPRLLFTVVLGGIQKVCETQLLKLVVKSDVFLATFTQKHLCRTQSSESLVIHPAVKPLQQWLMESRRLWQGHGSVSKFLESFLLYHTQEWHDATAYQGPTAFFMLVCSTTKNSWCSSSFKNKLHESKLAWQTGFFPGGGNL